MRSLSFLLDLQFPKVVGFFVLFIRLLLGNIQKHLGEQAYLVNNPFSVLNSAGSSFTSRYETGDTSNDLHNIQLYIHVDVSIR